MPVHAAFQRIVCPHYTAECAIYVALAIIAAPTGKLMNASISAGAIFVMINLGVTAKGTREWYSQRFGPESVKRRWCMLLYVY